MLDPFFPPPQFLANAIRPTADSLGLLTLPLHFHEVLVAWTCYNLVFALLSPFLSTWLFPSFYTRLSPRARLNWDVHVTSLVQSSFISLFAIAVICADEERKQMGWAGRIWGYTGAGGAVQGLAAGYFLWDLTVSIWHLRVLGWGSLAHAISALLVTSFGFRPFANYYGLNFILYEISTPFLNIHWFCDKFNRTGSRLQLYNGIVLLATFFLCRVVWGNYQSLRIYSDIWVAFDGRDVDSERARNNFIFSRASELAVGGDSGKLVIPKWLVFIYLGSNTVLNLLNMYWFARMIRAVRKRFEPQSEVSKNEKLRRANVVGRKNV